MPSILDLFRQQQMNPMVHYYTQNQMQQAAPQTAQPVELVGATEQEPADWLTQLSGSSEYSPAPAPQASMLPDFEPTTGSKMEAESRNSIDNIMQTLLSERQKDKENDRHMQWMSFFSKLASSNNPRALGALGEGAEALTGTMREQAPVSRKADRDIAMAQIEQDRWSQNMERQLSEDASQGELRRAQAEYYRAGRSGERANAPERKITRLMQTFGVDEKTAVGIVDGTTKVVTDPDTGVPFMVDLITGTSRPLNAAQSASPSGQPEEETANVGEKERTSLYNLANKATGLKSAAADAYGSLTAFDPTGLAPVPEDIIAARTQIDAESNQLIKQLQNSPRFSEGERSAIKKEISISPKMLQSPQLLQAKMKGVDASLRDKLALAQEEANDMSLPKEVRQDARRDASSISNFLKKLDVPQGRESGKGKPSLGQIWGTD